MSLTIETAGYDDAATQRLLLRLEIEALYAAYATALDEWRLEEWPALFTEQCLYRVIPRENHEKGLPMSIMFCESRGMLEDRVMALRETSVYSPRTTRHMTSGLDISMNGDGSIHAEANIIVFRSQLNRGTEIRSAGRYVDTIVREGEELKFKERICVLDTHVSPNTLVIPM